MKRTTRSGRPPAIVISRDDHARLTGLATAALDRLPEVAEVLLGELDRARVVGPASLPATAVRMGSQVTYEADGATRTVSLVYPGEADIAAGRISIMTPVGTALIGLSQGQSITWTARNGAVHALTIVAVRQPEAAEPA